MVAMDAMIVDLPQLDVTDRARFCLRLGMSAVTTICYCGANSILLMMYFGGFY